MNTFFVWLIIFSGCGMAVQAVINAQLGRILGGVPIFAAWWSFFIGSLAVLLIGIFSGQINHQNLRLVMSQPVYFHLGGLMGALVVTMTILAAPRLGVATTAMLIIFGQLGMALCLDKIGFLGLPARPLDWQKIVGLSCVFLGVYLFNQVQ